METVLAGFVILFIILFAALTLSGALMSNQESLNAAWDDMQARIDQHMRTQLDIIDTRVLDSGATLELVVRNNGTTRLSDFNRWDFILHYYDENTPPVYHVDYLQHTSVPPLVEEWTVTGIYNDEQTTVEEVYEPGILNPGEQALVRAKVIPSIGEGTALQAVLSAPNGAGVSAVFTREIPVTP